MSHPNRITIASEIQFSDPLPKDVDVVVIGGGVIGVFTALNLAEAGRRVLLCEKGRIAGEQSSRNWGWIRQQGRDEAELPIAMQSVGLWRDIDRRLNGACGVQQNGVAYLTTDRSELPRFEAWVETARRHGLHSEMMTPAQIKESFSGKSDHGWIGGVRTPSDCKGEPWQAVPAVARHAHALGVVMIENCAVRRLDMQAGKVAGVVTEMGRVACHQVVLAGGAWSRLFLGAHGVKIPQLSVLATAARTGPLPEFARLNAVDDALAIRRRDDGGYTLATADRHLFHLGLDGFASFRQWLPELRRQWRHTGFRLGAPKGFPDGWRTPRQWAADDVTPFEDMRVLEPDPMPGAVGRMTSRFAARFGQIGQAGIAEAWSGMIDAMPDIVPIVDAVPQLPGLTLAAGMSGHGFGIGPGFGRAIARRLLGEPDEHDLSRFRFDRFTDGSVLKQGPAL